MREDKKLSFKPQNRTELAQNYDIMCDPRSSFEFSSLPFASLKYLSEGLEKCLIWGWCLKIIQNKNKTMSPFVASRSASQFFFLLNLEKYYRCKKKFQAKIVLIEW